MKFTLAIAAIAATLSTIATAATVQVTNLGTGNATPVLFAAPDAITGTVTPAVNDTVGGVRRSPWQGTALDGQSYTSVSGGGSATYHVGLSNALSFVWGSPDDYNALRFFLGDTLQGTITGVQVVNQVKPITTAPASVPSAGFAFVKLALEGGLAFDKVVFASNNNAFEYASVVATPVPVPAAGALLISALAGMGLIRRRRAAA